jgi:hypothetical protein
MNTSNALESTTAATLNISTMTAVTEDNGNSIPGLTPQNWDAFDNEDLGDEENERPPQIKMALLPFEPGTILLEATAPSEHSVKIKRPIIRKLHHTSVVFKDQLQRDIGANCGATNEASILWHYQLLTTPIPITTYSEDKTKGASCVAIGTGSIIKIMANDSTVSEWTMLHTPRSTGTILLPDRYMHDHSEISEFNHNGRKDSHGCNTKHRNSSTAQHQLSTNHNTDHTIIQGTPTPRIMASTTRP